MTSQPPLLELDGLEVKLGGRPVEFIVEDDEGKPAVGLTKARSLVETAHILLLGPCRQRGPLRLRPLRASRGHIHARAYGRNHGSGGRRAGELGQGRGAIDPLGITATQFE